MFVTHDDVAVVGPYVEQSHLASTVFASSVAAFLVGELSQVLRVRRGATSVDVRAEVLFRAMFFAGILMLPSGRAVAPRATSGGGAWLFSLGVVIGGVGLALRWWSFLTLGRYFTLVVRASGDQPIVNRGPYRVLRHPSYAGLLLAFGGGGLMWGNWLSTAGSVGLLLVALLYRLRIEERALTAALGDRYRCYAAGRARLIPYVW